MMLDEKECQGGGTENEVHCEEPEVPDEIADSTDSPE